MTLQLSYNEVHQLVAKTAQTINDSPFSADVIVAIGGGGFIPARILRTFIKKPLVAVSISRYMVDKDPLEKPIRLQWIDGIEKLINGSRVLLVDEVDDEGTTLADVAAGMLKAGAIEVATFVLHYKRKKKKAMAPSGILYRFICQETEDIWIEYPWENITPAKE